MRTWTRLIPAVLLILPFTPALLRAADPDIKSLNDRLDQLSQKVKTLEDNVTSNSLRGNRVEAELRAVREELGRIRELLERMAQQQGAIQRQAGYDPRSVSPGGAIPTTGTITVQNNYTAPATVHINNQTFRVEPGQTRPISGVPTGLFQYSVDVEGYGTVEPPRSDTLRPWGYRINIYPRMPF
jgi:hypothetical protein